MRLHAAPFHKASRLVSRSLSFVGAARDSCAALHRSCTCCVLPRNPQWKLLSLRCELNIACLEGRGETESPHGAVRPM